MCFFPAVISYEMKGARLIWRTHNYKNQRFMVFVVAGVNKIREHILRMP